MASIESPVPVRHAYPIMLDVTDRLVVIVGGGAVAVRKAQGVIRAGGTRVRCVAPNLAEALPPEVEKVGECYEMRHLSGAFMAFAATDDPSVNEAVVRDARAAGILVSRADLLVDGVDRGDFITPARHCATDIVVSVVAGSPALAGLVRDGIARGWDPRWTKMARAMSSLRPMIQRSTGMSVEARRQALRRLATEEALSVLDAEGFDGLKAWLMRSISDSHG